MYAKTNPRTKKDLRAQVAAGPVDAIQIGPWPAKLNGQVCIEGPHYPKPHRWYATVELEDGQIVKVIS